MGQSTSRNLPFTSTLNKNSMDYHSNNTLNDPNSDISSKSSTYIPSASSSSAPSTIIPQSTFRSRRLSSLSLNISKRRKKANFLKHFKKSQTSKVPESPTVTDMVNNRDVIQEDDQGIDIFHPNHDPVVTPSMDSSIDSLTEPLPSPIGLEQTMTSSTTGSSNTIPLERHESIQETINMSDILGTEYPINTRESLIQNEYSNIVNQLEASLLNQFQTLSNLLENVTMTTLRRLIAFSNSSNLESLFNNNNNTFPGSTDPLTGDRINNTNNNDVPRYNSNSTPEINVSSDEYNGVRIDQINPQHNDQIIRDANFNEFIQGLNDEHLLHRELGLQIINEQNLSFFRAFRFNNSNQFGFNSRIQDFERLIPVLIVGVVGLTDNSNNSPTTDNSENNNGHGLDDYEDIIEQSHTESMRPPHSTTETDTLHTNEQQQQQQQPEDNYRSWIIIVMAHHYSSTDPVLQSMPLFINLLTSYVTTNNSNSFSASNPDPMATGIPASVSPPSATTSSDSSNPDLENFRNSLFQIFNKNHNRKLTQLELDKYKNTLFKFKSENDSSSTEIEDDVVYHDTVSTISSSSSIVSKLFEKNDRCPICLIDYERNDIGRFLSHCKHEFHKECIDQWLLSDNSCPICRGKGI